MSVNWDKTDVYELVNDLAAETMGSNATITAIDTTSFVAVGELLLSTSKEKTLNALTQMFARDIFSIRPYSGKLDILLRDSRPWGNVQRKITALYKDVEESSDNNTDVNANNIKTGSTCDPFEQNLPEVIETVFVGTDVIQKSLTNLTQDQLNVAFKSEEDFVSFLGMLATAFENELEKTFENMRRAAIVNYIGALKATGNAVDLAEEFNKTYNTTYTREELKSTYFENFYKFIMAYINKVSNLFTEFSSNYHVNIDDYAKIPRHTPKERQRMICYEPFFIDGKANVLSGLFNPEMLEIGDYEKVNFWQNINEPEKIDVTARYLGSDGSSTTDDVEIDDVLGILYDVEAVGWCNVFETTNTIFNPRGNYYNVWYHAQSHVYNDMTENGILFYIGEGGEPEEAEEAEENNL